MTQRTDDQTAYWNEYFKRVRDGGTDLDWRGRWTDPFISVLREAGSRDVLELGCGTGNDAARLAAEGMHVVGVDLSAEAIATAGARHGGTVEFRVADMSVGLPFGDARFDAVMANVSLHMFSDAVTRSIVEDVRRVLRPGGLFLFHVNALDDRPLRERARPIVRELEPNYVLEEAGQRVRYFSREYLLDLLAGWQIVALEHVALDYPRETGSFEKRVWRGVARKS